MEEKTYYSYALDENQCLINAHDAQKGHEYFCLSCGSIMIPKQGKIRTWHFAHKVKNDKDNCSYETYIHKLAKEEIRKCFLESEKFEISYHGNAKCDVGNCPLGCSDKCDWSVQRTFDLKRFYDNCEEEVTVGDFRADLLITNKNRHDLKPIFIEICVTHESTEKKLESGHRIIEIHIGSEDDINKIVSTSKIEEKKEYSYFGRGKKPNDVINFYNFKRDEKRYPTESKQRGKSIFYIDNKGFFRFFDGWYSNEQYVNCLDQNPEDVEKSVFRIESRTSIDWNYAFYKLCQSGLGIKYCTMCKYYCYNEWYMKSMCILYKSKGTGKFPDLRNAKVCPHFKFHDYEQEGLLTEKQLEQECKIYIKSNLIN